MQRIKEGSLAWLIQPLLTSEFESDYYERRLCLVNRTTPHYYTDLLSNQDLDRVLGTHGLSRPEINLVHGEEDLDQNSYLDGSGRVDPVAVAKRFDEGATVIFTQLQRRVPALAKLCVSLGKLFGSRIQTNIYLTPPGAQGFKPHWDTHDVFVLQVSGRKLWSIYDTKVTLPLKGQQFDAALNHAGPVTEEFELNPGSVVYVPRGLIHSAQSSDAASLHITLGITAFTWADFFVESVAAVSLENESLRRNLPMGFADGNLSAEERAQMYREQLSILQSGFNPDPVWRHFKDEVLARNTPLFTDLLGARLRSDVVTGESTVSRRTDIFVELENSDETCAVRFLGTEVTLPVGLLPAIKMATTSESFRVQDLPDCVNAEGKVTLVNRLIKEGLLFVDLRTSEAQQ